MRGKINLFGLDALVNMASAAGFTLTCAFATRPEMVAGAA
jgi:predicted XRE-type DNA-binding protein